MSTWIYIFIGIIIIGFLLIRRMKMAAGIPVLKCKIGSPDGLNYIVTFEKIHPDTKDIEYVRMVLNFTAKILFVLEKKHKNLKDDILDFIKNVSKTDMTSKDIDRLIPIGISITEGTPTSRIIEGILCFKDLNTRNIITKLPFPWFENQLSHSVFALIKITVDKLDDSHREYLKKSLNYMADKYESGVNPKELKTMVNLPNEAFLSIFFKNNSGGN